MLNNGQHNFLYKFLINPKYKIGRHILLVLGLAIIALNQVFFIYIKDLAVLGKNTYWLCLESSILYIAMGYLNIYSLIPQFLLHKKYVLYFTLLLLMVALFCLSQHVQEYILRSALSLPLRITSYNTPYLAISFISYCASHSVCLLGSATGILFKHFTTEGQRVNELEKEHIQSEVDSLKEQIAPDFLFGTLNRASILVKTNAEKASEILMKLSKLLRYQLYDCRRDKVLLSSDVNFIATYLALEQLYSNKVNYRISTAGNINRVFIPPLLFVPFVRYAVSEINNQPNHITISLYFEINNEPDRDSVLFNCVLSDPAISTDNDFSAIRKRLNILFHEDYILTISGSMIKLQLNLSGK